MHLFALSFTLLLAFSLHAGVLIKPNDAIVQNYGKGVTITKKSVDLNSAQAQQVSKQAKAKLKGKHFRVFCIDKASGRVGYAVLINEKVRTKNAAILYLINMDGTIKAIEIVAFNEPQEFIPSKQWQSLFKGKSIENDLRVDKEIPTITGATISARNIADGARVALALYKTVLKAK